MARDTISELAILGAVRLCLKQKGRIIADIEREYNTTYKGDRKQQMYRDKPVWHSRDEINNFVMQHLKVDAKLHVSMSDRISNALSMLSSNGIILNWNVHKQFGLWRLYNHPDLFQDFVVVVGKMDAERFRQFKIQQHQSALHSIKGAGEAINVWALNSHRHHDVWSMMREGDRVMFAVSGSGFSQWGSVYKTLKSRDVATKLWGNSPRIGQHDCLILFSSTEETSKPFHETCRNAGIRIPSVSDGVYIAKNRVLDVSHTHVEYTGVVLDYSDEGGPAARKSEVVTRFIRDTKKVLHLKKKYKDRCQICGYVVQMTPNQRYSEVHHIHPLKDGGDDDYSNMLVLCPTHHVEFDYKIIGICVDGKTVIDRNERCVGELTMHEPHKIALKNIKFHLLAMCDYEF